MENQLISNLHFKIQCCERNQKHLRQRIILYIEGKKSFFVFSGNITTCQNYRDGGIQCLYVFNHCLTPTLFITVFFIFNNNDS